MVALPVAPGTEAGKDAALSADIRLLGRVLGEVVRDQAGDEVFDLVEQVRQRAVDARRDGRSPLEELRTTLPGRPTEDQLHLIRAYGFLSLLANTAEDVHHERRRRYHRRHGSRPSWAASRPPSIGWWTEASRRPGWPSSSASCSSCLC